MAYEALEGILTENEKKVYVELLRLGESTASPILEKTGLQNSVFYRTIHRLMEKGFVTYILKGKIKHFKAVDPEAFLSTIKEKELEIKELVPQLKEIQKISNFKANAEVYTGIKGLLKMYYTLIEDAKKGEEYLFFGPRKNQAENAMKEVYLLFRKYRYNKKLKVYGINPKNTEQFIEKTKMVNQKYIDSPIPPNIAIFRDKIVMAIWGEMPTGILIQSKDVAEQYKELFWEIWKKSS